MNLISADRRFRRLSASVAAVTLALPLSIGAVPAGAATFDAEHRLREALPIADPGPYLPYPGDDWSYGTGPYAGFGTAPTATALEATDATEEQSKGLVLISTTLDFGAGAGRGTGMVIDSNGVVVTNHHVVEGATDIEVTVAATGKTYTAELIGANARKDVAVLQLEDAPVLDTVHADTGGTSPGSAVTAVGDAGGDGGSLTAVPGSVTALRQSVTVDNEDGTSRELRNLIEVDADIIPGDSGGALLDPEGDVVGMNVAASTGTADITGYVIPIARVLRVADAVLAGADSGATAIGYDAFLGVELDRRVSDATIAGVVPGSPAESAGLAAGDTVTTFDGQAVTSADQLRQLIATRDAGDSVRVGWSDGTGSRTATVTLAEAPIA